jgi:hypothetical protein
LAALNYQRRWRGARKTSHHKADDENASARHDRQEKLRFQITRRAIRAETPARPETPASAFDS